MPPVWGSRLKVAVVLVIVLSACGSDTEAPEAGTSEFDGLTREQLEEQAAPMTPAEAEQLGIVDTTIRIEPPVSPDSVPQDTLAP